MIGNFGRVQNSNSLGRHSSFGSFWLGVDLAKPVLAAKLSGDG